jgi:Zn finger protein HypA/HybF involved in hydrogenase expression
MFNLSVPKLQCKICGHSWIPRKDKTQGSPGHCPNCQSKNWNIGRTRKIYAPRKYKSKGAL